MATATYTVVEAELYSVRRLPSSVNGNPRWEFSTSEGKFRTVTDAMCAYKGEPRKGILTMILNSRRGVVDYGWSDYPMN